MIFDHTEPNHPVIHAIQTCRYCQRCLTHPRSVYYLFDLTVTDAQPRKIEKSYLVFIAIKEIHEGMELTIDYHPNLGPPTKGKWKRKRRRSDTCMCDAKLCRGVRP